MIYPGMLENLYNNGVIPYVPYDLCVMTPVSPINTSQSGFMSAGDLKRSFLGDSGFNNMSNTNDSNYLDKAMKGQMYGYYGNSNDSFVGSNYRQNGTNQQAMQMYGGGYGGRIGNYSNAGNPYSMNGYGANSYGNPYAMNRGMGSYSNQTNPYLNRSYGNNPDYVGGATQNNGGFNRYDRRLQNGSGNPFKDAMNSEINDAKKGVLNSGALLKGLLAAGILIATPILIFKGAKSPATSSKFNNFLSKLNPKNWSGGKIDWSKFNPKNWFAGSSIDWSKLNPKNWFKGSGSKIDWSKFNPKNWFKSSGSKIDWSKLNPKNWFKSSGSKIDWSKLNPKNWFKGSGSKIDWSKFNPKNWFKSSGSKIDWSKLNPKNWFKKKP